MAAAAGPGHYGLKGSESVKALAPSPGHYGLKGTVEDFAAGPGHCGLKGSVKALAAGPGHYSSTIRSACKAGWYPRSEFQKCWLGTAFRKCWLGTDNSHPQTFVAESRATNSCP